MMRSKRLQSIEDNTSIMVNINLFVTMRLITCNFQLEAF